MPSSFAQSSASCLSTLRLVFRSTLLPTSTMLPGFVPGDSRCRTSESHLEQAMNDALSVTSKTITQPDRPSHCARHAHTPTTTPTPTLTHTCPWVYHTGGRGTRISRWRAPDARGEGEEAPIPPLGRARTHSRAVGHGRDGGGGSGRRTCFFVSSTKISFPPVSYR